MAGSGSFDAVVHGLPRASAAGVALRWSGTALSLTSMGSALLFGLYILAFYAAAASDGDMARWNRILPRLYEPATPAATLAIGLHFGAGGLILVLGAVQLIGALRTRYPAVHRWIGRLYASAALLAGLGGLGFIAMKGTVGGLPMDLGFSLYGALMVWAAAQAWRHARARRFELHRAWALRLFALAIGSWLYRMEYGFWMVATGGAGHTDDFTGRFDVVMAFFFYLPNLLLVEAFIRARKASAPPAVKTAAAVVLAAATSFVLLGTYHFTKDYWGPAIVDWLRS
ncbi:DUF2306 domain-containing protein [Aquabacterium sp. A7-Y]|uniref:DUF2306 domain-containing protein n=1 Tax=Aquabacterium sp. A7-Y TaxID=1349605 RepID=UPI00223DD776|nr:DUF2306 domain-containing protein [Aquabacterium sp. A7-Y]MCW7541710.1 DUF2306 domain-containing protein [Aquabacterium sp. A7-Y]